MRRSYPYHSGSLSTTTRTHFASGINTSIPAFESGTMS